MNNPANRTLGFLLTHEIQQAYILWDKNQPPRNGYHASSALEPEDEHCTRQHVLAARYPEERNTKEQYWSVLAKFANGWSVHSKIQWDILQPTGMVVLSDGHYELDLTHHDENTGIDYSPDVIIDYASYRLPIEIKGINTLDFQGCPETYTLESDGTYKLYQEARPGLIGATLEQAMHRNKSIRAAVPQLQLYMHLLKLRKGIVFVEDKNTQDFLLWVVDYDPAAAIPALKNAEKVKAWKDSINVLPDRICKSATEPRAKRCPFAEACFKEGR